MNRLHSPASLFLLLVVVGCGSKKDGEPSQGSPASPATVETRTVKLAGAEITVDVPSDFKEITQDDEIKLATGEDAFMDTNAKYLTISAKPQADKEYKDETSLKAEVDEAIRHYKLDENIVERGSNFVAWTSDGVLAASRCGFRLYFSLNGKIHEASGFFESDSKEKSQKGALAILAWAKTIKQK